MGASRELVVGGGTRIHALAPQCKVAAAFLFVIAVVSTPREEAWAFIAHAALLIAVARAAGLRLSTARRLVVETPFVAFALFLPLLGAGERVEVAGISLSREGLWAAWNILAKATLGFGATIVLTATTPIPQVLKGLDRLKTPRPLTAIASFMVRYVEVVAGEAARMRVARLSRGYDPHWLWQARALASSVAVLFIRSYERGERVYVAMMSRGYAGEMPGLGVGAAPVAQWALALALPAGAAAVCLLAWSAA